MAKSDTPSSMDEAPGGPAPERPKPGVDPDATALGAAQVQDAVDTIEDHGYQGVSPDPTPRAHYSVQGVLAGKPTPETDPEQAAKAVASARALDASGQPTAPKDK